MSRLLHNLPIEDLNESNDYLGVVDKANLIKTILESNTDQFHEIKMFALYGEWGSGKSTLMKYLERELKSDFNTFFFDTWQFEKDDNLPQTLLEYLLHKSESLGEDFCGKILKYAGKILRGLGKSVKVQYKLLDIDPSEFVKEFDKEEPSFYEALKGFKTEFIRWEDRLTKEKPKKYNIIFIDDLDRCEPENVLNLLSAIKLFFTYGEKTIFFFGVDKKAVQQAIQTKYKDVVKSEEYLEKVFDVSFSMPKHENVLKLVATYFDERDIQGEKLNEKIAIFFRKLHFTNPRRLKKVLNKYILLANVKESLEEDHAYTKFIGNITTSKYTGNYFETILTLYFIVLKESYPELFATFFDLKLKESMFINAYSKSGLTSQRSINSLKFYLKKENITIKGLDLIFNASTLRFDNTHNETLKVSTIFIPNNILGMEDDLNNSGDTYNKIHISEKLIDFYFLKYLCDNLESFRKLQNYSDKSISDIYQGIKQIL
ncbi:P-loop NTPase fold protein [uncultured Kordia sp.]|uniref:KAP family P-loop NTPase fold protein n=1 Tax=uncultured Kordia sp. TaxID=507699 RepID=UPI00263169B6|nr:P-loop NTPase fold protein [uncultured Kordia sp.]